MLTLRAEVPRAAAGSSRALGIRDLEDAGIRVAERRFDAGDLIYIPGDPDRSLYFLTFGTVRLYKYYGDYKQATLLLLKDEGVFGEMSLRPGSGQRHFAEAVTDGRVAAVPKGVIESLTQRDPSFALKLLATASERVRQSEDAMESLLSREVSTRLARLLLTLGDRFGQTTDTGTLLDVRLTHQELANMIVSTREAVSKVMSAFKRDGLIEVRGQRISVMPALAEGLSALPARRAAS